jgi:hypothetical protein
MRTIPVTFTQTISVEWRMGWMSLLHCLRTWQVLLSDKNLDEPLWAVRPPESASSHPFIREWATRTLELAGYDPRLMVYEWEIYWRRKGV